jgi:hypothetical protein
MILEGSAAATDCAMGEIKIRFVYVDWKAVGIAQLAAETNQSLPTSSTRFLAQLDDMNSEISA